MPPRNRLHAILWDGFLQGGQTQCLSESHPLVVNVHLPPLVWQITVASVETCLPKDNPHEVI